jgi:hypothetical protein
MAMSNPYTDLPTRAFWSPAVGKRDALDIDELWEPKWPVMPRMKIATFGSCFAQHFGRALARRGYQWFDAEPAPAALSEDTAKAFNYGVFSARTGNIYTVSLLHQWAQWATGEATPPDEIWEKDGRFYDPFRPAVEPKGFASAEEARASQALTIEAFGRAMRECNLFVFTLGLTESWWHKDGYEYPMCPGTVAGEFDPEQHEFRNQSYAFIEKKLRQAIQLIRKVNPKVRILLTVSPVPLTATKSDNHVLVATTYSKSTLRAVAGDVAGPRKFVDYFPSYEIIASPPFEGQFYSDNKRGVEMYGVDHVMANFFACMGAKFPKAVRTGENASGPKAERRARAEAIAARKAAQAERRAARAAPAEAESSEAKDADELVCEEELLAAFGPKD